MNAFTPPPLPSIPGITDGAQTGGFPAGQAAPATNPSANISDAVYAQAAANAATGAVTPPAQPPAEEAKKRTRAKAAPSTRKVSSGNTAAGAGAQAAKFELPDLLAIRVEQLNATNPNDDRLLLLRALQMTEVDFATVDHALGHTVGAAADFIGAEAAPSAGALRLYGNVMLALGTLYQARLLPSAVDYHQPLLLMALRLLNTESMLAATRDQLITLQSNQQHAPQFQAAAQQAPAPVAPVYTQHMQAPVQQAPQGMLPPTHAFPQQGVYQQPQQFQQPMPQQPSAGALPGQPNQFLPPQHQMQAPQHGHQPTLQEWQAHQAALLGQGMQVGIAPGTPNAYPPGFTPPFPG